MWEYIQINTKVQKNRFINSIQICTCWYQNVQITTSTGYASMRMVISTRTGILGGPLIVLYKSAVYQYAQITTGI
jgi:hypothetical protein